MSSEDYQYDEDGNRIVKRVTKINIDTDSVAEKVAEKMKEQKALEYFEKEKQELNIKYNTTDFNDCETPSELADMIELCEQELREKRIPKRPSPSGKPINNYGNSEEFDSPEALMDSIYNRAYDRGIKIKTEDGIKAREQIKQLFKDMITGKAWKQLKSGEERFPTNTKELMNCPKCNSTINAKRFPPCPICGYDPIKENV